MTISNTGGVSNPWGQKGNGDTVFGHNSVDIGFRDGDQPISNAQKSNMTWSDAASLALQGFNTVGDFIANKKEREQQKELTLETNALNEKLMREGWARDDHAITRMVKDAQAAGLSKFAVAGNNGTQSDPVNMANPADSMDSSLSSAFNDAMAHTMDIIQIQSAKAQNEKALAERNSIMNQDARAEQEHQLLMEKMGVDNFYQSAVYETNLKLQQAEAKLRDIEADVTKSKDERAALIDHYETLIKAYEAERDGLQLDEDKSTVYNPDFRGNRVANYRTGLATDNANMVYEAEVNRQRASQEQINTKVKRGKSDYEIAKEAAEVSMLTKEVEGWDKKRKAELANEWTNAVKNGASVVSLVIDGVRKTFDIRKITKVISALGV